jgi:hypothetical protein
MHQFSMVHAQPPCPSTLARNAANTRRNAAKVEQYLTQVEKAHGLARAWDLRQRFERGHVTLRELVGH